MQIIYRDEGAEFHGTTGHIVGTAIYNVTIEFGLNADVGGCDGWECTDVELVGVEIDALRLSAYQVEDACGRAAVIRAEGDIGDVIDASVEDYVEAA